MEPYRTIIGHRRDILTSAPVHTVLVYSHSLLTIPINYHPMNPLPSIVSSNIADLFTKSLATTAHHRYFQLAIGDTPPTPTTLAAPTVASILRLQLSPPRQL